MNVNNKINHSLKLTDYKVLTNNTSQQDFGTGKVYCVSNVTFHAESKYPIKIFPLPTVFVQWPFYLGIFISDFFIHEQIF